MIMTRKTFYFLTMKICTALQNDVKLSIVAQTAVNESDALTVVMKIFTQYFHKQASPK